MDVEQALTLLRQVCAAYRGSLQDHHALQAALTTIEAALEEQEEQECGNSESSSHGTSG